MRHPALVASLIAFALAGQALAETGKGRYAPHGEGAMEPDAPPLSAFGADVVRVRAYPSLGSGSWMVELHALPDGSAEGEAVFFEKTRRFNWTRVGATHLRLWPKEWSSMIGQVDALLAEPQVVESEQKSADGRTMLVCVTVDGTGHQIERRRDGQDTWMTSISACDRDPSEAIARLVFAAAATGMCRTMQWAGPCDRTKRPPEDALAEYRESLKR